MKEVTKNIKTTEAIRPTVKDSRIWTEMLADMAGRGVLAADASWEGREGK